MNNKVLKRWAKVIERTREMLNDSKWARVETWRCIVDLAEEVDRLQEEVEVLDHGEAESRMYVDSLETELTKYRQLCKQFGERLLDGYGAVCWSCTYWSSEDGWCEKRAMHCCDADQCYCEHWQLLGPDNALRQLGQRNIDLTNAQNDIETLRAENERLRKALREQAFDHETGLHQIRLDRNTTDAS